ncbi:MYND-type domain-containing protein [Balamuthia mandrillaris]
MNAPEGFAPPPAEVPTEEVLGFLGEEVVDQLDAYCSKFGGLPCWVEDVSPPLSLLCCECCGSEMVLVTQLYAPLPHAPEKERILFLFVCPKEGCSSVEDPTLSWRLLRWQRTTMENREQLKQQEVDEDEAQCTEFKIGDWASGGGNEDWGGSSWESQLDDEELEKGFEALLNLNESPKDAKTKARHDSSDFATPGKTTGGNGGERGIGRTSNDHFTAYYMEEEIRPVCKRNTQKKNQQDKQLLAKYSEALSAIEEMDGTGGDEEYEATEASDKAFLRFQRYMEENPEQCLRYILNGECMWVANKGIEPDQVPPCWHCGFPRIFEFQLLPTFIYLIHQHAHVMPCTLDFSTVAAFSCSASCQPSASTAGFVQEFAFQEASL